MRAVDSHDELEIRERKIVSRFKKSPKYNRFATYIAASFGLISVILFALSISIGSLDISISSIAVFFLQLSITVTIANILFYNLIESPRRFLIQDADRELSEFMIHNPNSREVLIFLESIETNKLNEIDSQKIYARVEKNFEKFLNLKSRTQVARAGSKKLALKFWRAELITMNEFALFKEFNVLQIRDPRDINFLSRLRRPLEMLESVYIGRLGDLPCCPEPRNANGIVEAINRVLRPEQTES